MTDGMEIFEESIGDITNAISYTDLISTLFYSWFVMLISVGTAVYTMLYDYVGKLPSGEDYQSCMPYKTTVLIWLLIISNYLYYEDVMLYEHSSNIHVLKLEQSVISEKAVAKEFVMIPMQALLGLTIVCLIFVKTMIEYYDMRKDMCSIPKFLVYLWEGFNYITMVSACEKQSHTMGIPCNGLVLNNLPTELSNVSLPPLFLFICSPLFVFFVRASITYFIIVCIFESVRSLVLLVNYTEMHNLLSSASSVITFEVITSTVFLLFWSFSWVMITHAYVISTIEEATLGLYNLLRWDMVTNASFLLCVYSLRLLSCFKDDNTEQKNK